MKDLHLTPGGSLREKFWAAASTPRQSRATTRMIELHAKSVSAESKTEN
jgi:hypothetical protein